MEVLYEFTAAGEVLHASATGNEDLFWAVRGGGGNFGVVASLQYRLHPLGSMVTAGLVAHPFEKAREVLRFYRDLTASLPDELTVFAVLTCAPDGSGTPIAAMALCHCGSLEEGAAAVRPIKEFGPPIMDMAGPMPYEAVNAMLDEGFPRGALNYWKSSFLSSLTDETIDTLIDQFSRCPSPMSSLLIEHFHWAVTRVAPGQTAFPHRVPGFNLLVLSQWLEPADSDANVRWAREAYDAMQPHMASGRFVSYMGDDEGQDSVAHAYGANYARLQGIKRKFDPANLFHLNQNIKPA